MPDFQPFDAKLAAHAHHAYRVRLDWDVAQRTYRVWVDGTPQLYNGSVELPMMLMPKDGMNLLIVHARNRTRTARQSIHVFWKDVSIRSVR